jgi:hypothetical protein
MEPHGPIAVAVLTVVAAATAAADHGVKYDGDPKAGALNDSAAVVAHVIAADNSISDREAAAWETAFGSPPAHALTRAQNGPPVSDSPLLKALVEHDRIHGSAEAWLYYIALTELAFQAVGLRDVASTELLANVQNMCNGLLAVLDQAGLPRPGRPATASNLSAKSPAPPSVVENVQTLDELMTELDGLTGLAAVKEEVKVLTQVLRIRKLRAEAHLPVADMSHHLVFVGNPGTGKTTVARIIAGIYRALGVVAKGQLVDTDRSGLVAGFVGQTAIRTSDMVKSALGGVLLIDEAYALSEGGPTDFGHEAIDELVKAMEDHRDEFAVIVAGYPAEMTQFLDDNPGLRSRFPKTISFPDYSTEELVGIFKQLGAKNSYNPDPDALTAVQAWLERCPRSKGFGNARVARNLFEDAQRRQAWRLRDVEHPTTEELCTLIGADIPPAPD